MPADGRIGLYFTVRSNGANTALAGKPPTGRGVPGATIRAAAIGSDVQSGLPDEMVV